MGGHLGWKKKLLTSDCIKLEDVELERLECLSEAENVNNTVLADVEVVVDSAVQTRCQRAVSSRVSREATHPISST